MRRAAVLVLTMGLWLSADASVAHRLATGAARVKARQEAVRLAQSLPGKPAATITVCRSATAHVVNCRARYFAPATDGHGDITCRQTIRVQYVSRTSRKVAVTPLLDGKCVETGKPTK